MFEITKIIIKKLNQKSCNFKDYIDIRYKNPWETGQKLIYRCNYENGSHEIEKITLGCF